MLFLEAVGVCYPICKEKHLTRLADDRTTRMNSGQNSDELHPVINPPNPPPRSTNLLRLNKHPSRSTKIPTYLYPHCLQASASLTLDTRSN